MFGTIRRHQTWLWILIIAVMSVSLVVFFTDVDLRGQRVRGDFGTIYGRPIREEVYIDAHRETTLQYFLTYGDWPGRDAFSRQEGFDLDREARLRLLMNLKAQELDLQVSDSAWAEWVAGIFRDSSGGNFRKENYEQFVNQTLAREGIRESDFAEFVHHQVAIQQLSLLAGLPGRFVTPREAEAIYRQENEESVTRLMVFESSNYLAQVQVNPTNVALFYTNQMALYREPVRRAVSYVAFDATNFLADADQRLEGEANLSTTLEAIYQRNGAKFYTDPNNQVLPKEKALEKIRGEVRDQFALQAARRKAGEFAEELHELQPQQPANLGKLAEKHGLTIRTTRPFSESEGPEDLEVPQAFIRAAFALSGEEPFQGPVVGPDAVYVMTLKEEIPSAIPPLEAIRERVTEAYRQREAVELARQAGTKFYEAATNALAQGKPLDSVAAEHKVGVIDLPAFARSTRSLPEAERHLVLAELQRVASTINPGMLSRPNPTRDGGFLIYLKHRQPVSEEKLKAELPDFLETFRRVRQADAFREWFRITAEDARITGGTAKP
jgi:hypothetical protein